MLWAVQDWSLRSDGKNAGQSCTNGVSVATKEKEFTYQIMKRVFVLFSIVALAAVISVGCGGKGGSGSGVAVVDLDRIATAMGWIDDLQKGLQATDAELRAQLDQILRTSLKTIEDAKTQVGADAKLNADQITQLNSIQDPRELEKLPLTKEQRDKLLETVNRANQTWQQSVNSYQQTLQARRQSLILTYREKIRPVARRVAADRGMNVVMTPSDSLLYFDPQSADITDQVIDELQKGMSTSAPAAK
jgi:Skp family chaperone for outer membrane proteins